VGAILSVNYAERPPLTSLLTLCSHGHHLDGVLHYLGPGRPFAPETYTIACLSFDLLVAAYMAIAHVFGLVRGRRPAPR
jgi:hypothetical protein